MYIHKIKEVNCTAMHVLHTFQKLSKDITLCKHCELVFTHEITDCEIVTLNHEIEESRPKRLRKS